MRISDWSSDVCSSDLDHPIGKTAVVDLDRVQEVGGCLHLTDYIAHFFVQGFQQILERDSWSGLEDALELLHQIIVIEETHAAEKHVVPAQARTHLGDRTKVELGTSVLVGRKLG